MRSAAERLEVGWPDFAAVTGLGLVFFVTALVRFRKTVSLVQA